MTVTKVGGDQILLVPRFSSVERDASHGSDRVVAPMISSELNRTVSTSS